MRQFLLIVSSLPFLAFAQEAGIQWTEGLSWDAVKQKAKEENKFIFLDVFATWCGPCKLMEKEVYSNDTLGQFFNKYFISVKVQSDQTQKDSENIKNWYKDAETIIRQFRIEGYPSLVFLNPNGSRVEMQTGYKTSVDLIHIAKTALSPSKKYDDPYEEYELLLEEYQQGKKNMSRMPYFIPLARSLDPVIFKQALKEYTDYCLTLKPKERYNKENIQMWSNFGYLKSTTRAFQFFYKDGELIDKVMNQKGFAFEIVSRTINQEIVVSFLNKESNGKVVPGGMVVTGPAVKSDYSEANWKKLGKMIEEKYGRRYVESCVIYARIQWYTYNQNFKSLINWQMLQLRKFPPPKLLAASSQINNITWGIFLNATDKKLLSEALEWTSKTLTANDGSTGLMDTHACLLFKLGRKSRAIKWMEKAVNVEKSDFVRKGYETVLEQMKRNEPIYLNEGAKWEGIKCLNWKRIKYTKWIVISDPNGKPISGVSVVNKASNISKSSNEKGAVLIEVSLGDRIQISLPGFAYQEFVATKDPCTTWINLTKKSY